MTHFEKNDAGGSPAPRIIRKTPRSYIRTVEDFSQRFKNHNQLEIQPLETVLLTAWGRSTFATARGFWTKH